MYAAGVLYQWFTARLWAVHVTVARTVVVVHSMARRARTKLRHAVTVTRGSCHLTIHQATVTPALTRKVICKVHCTE